MEPDAITVPPVTAVGPDRSAPYRRRAWSGPTALTIHSQPAWSDGGDLARGPGRAGSHKSPYNMNNPSRQKGRL